MKKPMTYIERNAGKAMQRYMITSVGASLTRMERVGDSIVPVTYNSKIGSNVVILTPSGAASLSHLGLQPLGRERIEVSSNKIEVPEDWKDLPDKQKLAIAKKIGGKEVKRADAEKVIEGYINANSNTDSDGSEGDTEGDTE